MVETAWTTARRSTSVTPEGTPTMTRGLKKRLMGERTFCRKRRSIRSVRA